MHREHGRVHLLPVRGEAGHVLAEQVVARDDDEVVVEPGLVEHVADVADRAEPVVVRRRAVVHDPDSVTPGGPLLEVRGELRVRDDDRLVHAHLLQSLEDVVEHRLPTDLEQRLRAIERERVEPGRVAGGKNERLHFTCLRPTRPSIAPAPR